VEAEKALLAGQRGKGNISNMM